MILHTMLMWKNIHMVVIIGLMNYNSSKFLDGKLYSKIIFNIDLKNNFFWKNFII